MFYGKIFLRNGVLKEIKQASLSQKLSWPLVLKRGGGIHSVQFPIYYLTRQLFFTYLLSSYIPVSHTYYHLWKILFGKHCSVIYIKRQYI